ncbi:MAG TPA: DUF6686 family protein [Parafilimonas sp.]|nr:DUF6686 family protein [Parafilimonas sp.]
MFCDFEHLYFTSNGYVVYCKNCGCYQIAFNTTLLTLTEKDFFVLCKMALNKYAAIDYILDDDTKSIIIETPAAGMCLILSAKEAAELCYMLEEADTEIKALALIKMFNA